MAAKGALEGAASLKSKSSKSVHSDHSNQLSGHSAIPNSSLPSNGVGLNGVHSHPYIATTQNGQLPTVWEHNPNTRILVVGEKFTSGAVTLSLEKVGYIVTQLESHSQALEILGEQHNYKVVCVYSAGNPTIAQLITKLKQISGIPIIVIASGGGVEATSKYLKAGASDCLYTPVCSELLKIRISCILENIQMKEAFKPQSPRTAAIPLREVDSEKSFEKSMQIEELKKTITQLEQRIAWSDSELQKKETEIASLQQQLNAVSWRSSLLESEKHKGETLFQQLNQKDKEIDDLRKHMSRALETPIEVITRTMAQIAQGNLDQAQLKQAFSTLMQCVSSSSQMYQPAITKSQFLSSLNLDEMTRQWLLYEFTTGGLDTPSSTTVSVNLPPPSSPSPTPVSPSFSRISSPKSPRSPTNLQASLLPPSSTALRFSAENDVRPRSPKTLSVLVPKSGSTSFSDSKSPTSDSRMLKSGRSVDDILKRAKTMDMNIINNYNCNVWLLDPEEIAILSWAMFEDMGLVEQFKIPQVAFFQFLETLKGSYLTNPYHNFQHAFDVCQTCYMFCKTCNVRQYITPMDVFAMFVAALCHDIDHPGLNNTFQINSKSPLAVLYNDLSVLENHHCARAFYIMNDPKNNILTGLTPAEYKEFRRTVVSAILATDMTTHFELLTRFTTHLDARPFSIENKDDRQLIVDILLHSADISNTCKPFVISKRWSDLLLEEFLSQGDLEKEFSMPVSPFMDRRSTDHVRMTLNFMDYMVAPLCASLAKLFSGMRPLLENLQLNRAQWAEKANEPVKVKFQEPEKSERQAGQETSPEKPVPIKGKRGVSRSFTITRSGYDMLQKGPATVPLREVRRLSLETPKGPNLEVPRKPMFATLPAASPSAFSSPLNLSATAPPPQLASSPEKLKLFLPKLSAVHNSA